MAVDLASISALWRTRYTVHVGLIMGTVSFRREEVPSSVLQWSRATDPGNDGRWGARPEQALTVNSCLELSGSENMYV